MKPIDWKLVVDALLFVCLAALAAFGLIWGLVLPESVSWDTSLGRLRRTYAIEIQDVRALMAGLLKEKKDGGE